MVVAAANYDMGKGIRQSECSAWVLANSLTGDAQSGYFLSIEEQYLQQFEIPFELVVDESSVFKALVEKWRLERGSTSSIAEIVLCPAYQNIIGMGPKAIRFIISELHAEGDNPDHWFWALQALTRMNPVSEENEGNLREMANAWLAWAALEGYAR